LRQPAERHYYNPVHETTNVRYSFPGIGMTLVVGYEERAEYIVVVPVIEE
jgi:hypothetical protein